MSEVGQADGIATLDEAGKVPLTQLDIDEKIQDVAAGLITSGTHTNLTATYDDVTGKINDQGGISVETAGHFKDLLHKLEIFFIEKYKFEKGL